MTMSGFSRKSIIPACLGAAVSLSIVLAAEAKTSISVWYAGMPPSAQKIIKAFEDKNPNISLKFFNYDGNEPSKFLTAISAGTGPNIVMGYADSVNEWAAKNLILPLDGFIKERKFDLKQLPASSLELTTYNGSRFALTIDWDPDHVLWINEELFEQAGLNPKDPPKTTVEFEQVAAKLTVQDSSGRYTRAGWLPGEGWLYWHMYWPYAFGGSLYDKVKNAPTLNSPKSVKAFEWYKQWYTKYDFNKMISLGFFTGKAGMLMSGTWAGKAMAMPTSKVKRVGIYVGPHAPDAQPYVPCSGWAYMVTRNAKNLKETYKVLDFLMEPWVVTEICQGYSWLPASSEAKKDPAFAKDKFFSQFIKILSSNYDREWLASNPICKIIWTEMGKAAALVTSHKRQPAEALAAAQRVAETEMRKMATRIRIK